MQLTLGSAARDIEYVFRGVPGVHGPMFKNGVRPATVLEVGAGSGKLGIHFAVGGAAVLAVDIDPLMVKYEQCLAEAAVAIMDGTGYESSHVRFEARVGDMHDLDLPNEAFDLVFNEGSLEHFSRAEQVQMLREMVRVSKRWVCFFVPDAAHEESQRVAREVHHHYDGMPEHEVPLTRKEVAELARDAGLYRVVVEATMDRWWFVLGEVIP